MWPRWVLMPTLSADTHSLPTFRVCTYPELRHLDDQAHGHVDNGALPVVHGYQVGGQLVEPCVQP